MAELSIWDRDDMAHEAMNTYYLIFYSKVSEPVP